MRKKRIKLNDTLLELLAYSAGDLIPLLEEKKHLVYVKEMAFSFISESTKEEFQIQVLVTRDKADFIEYFQTVECQ